MMKIKSKIFVLIILSILFCAAANRIFAAETINLAGEWKFALDDADKGVDEKWFDQNLKDKIILPGILQAQNYGSDISIKTPWVLSLYDKFWFLREDYRNYAQAGRVKVPFLSQPPKHYLGAAWYQKEVEIPENWQGKRVTLFLERPHWSSTVWVDDAQVFATRRNGDAETRGETGGSPRVSKGGSSEQELKLIVRIKNRKSRQFAGKFTAD